MKLLDVLFRTFAKKEQQTDDISNVYFSSNWDNEYKNSYTIENVNQYKIFEKIYNSENGFNKQALLLFVLIKYDIKLIEVSKYLSRNKERYYQKLQTLYPNLESKESLTQKQKFEILKGFRPTVVKKENCYLNFLTASKKEEMLIFLEFDNQLTRKYSWLIDYLEGTQKLEQAWYSIKYYIQNDINFIVENFTYNRCISAFKEKGYLNLIPFPTTDLLIEYLPFSTVRLRFKQKGLTVKSKHHSKQIVAENLIDHSIFLEEDLNELKGYFIKTNSSINQLKNDFDKILQFYALLIRYI